MSGKESSSSSSTTATNIAEGDEIDTTLLEKRLEGLRDTQESVQGLSLWCQANKRHSQIIMDTWLRILRKSNFYMQTNPVHCWVFNDMTANL